MSQYLLFTTRSRYTTKMKFLIPSILIVAAVNAGPLVNSTESVTEQTKIDITTSAPLDVAAPSSDIPQSKTDPHYEAGNVRSIH